MSGVAVHRLARSELGLVGEIDRSERIDALVEQDGTELIVRAGRWESQPWDREGDGEHSVAAKRRELAGYLDAGGVVLGAFLAGRVVGIGAVVPELRAGVAQIAFLHVSREARGSGVGTRLTAEMEALARRAGATSCAVSATPTGNTVSFYRGRGYSPTAHPVPELVEQEPDDIHLSKSL